MEQGNVIGDSKEGLNRRKLPFGLFFMLLVFWNSFPQVFFASSEFPRTGKRGVFVAGTFCTALVEASGWTSSVGTIGAPSCRATPDVRKAFLRGRDVLCMPFTPCLVLLGSFSTDT